MVSTSVTFVQPKFRPSSKNTNEELEQDLTKHQKKYQSRVKFSMATL